jgi:rfaE bifunctional protein kinase chain/domain
MPEPTDVTGDEHLEEVEEALRRAASASVAVFGDLCLDAYWQMAPGADEVSVETGRPVRRVRSQSWSPGGAANVAADLRALAVREVRAVGLVGEDLFGRHLIALLEALGVDCCGVLCCQGDWQTMVYGKPYVADEEQDRVDFGAFNRLAAPSMDALAAEVARAAEACDAVVLNQQVPAGTSPPAMVERLNEVIAAHPGCAFLVDSRHHAELYRGAMLKVNAREAARLCGEERPAAAPVSAEEARRFAAELSARTGRPVFVTRGADGIAVSDAEGVDEFAGVPPDGPSDPVGAGDAAAAALAAVIGAGGTPRQAARIANLAASVTVRKLRTTGAASPDEIRHAARLQAGN